jgi:hypothetical protein
MLMPLPASLQDRRTTILDGHDCLPRSRRYRKTQWCASSGQHGPAMTSAPADPQDWRLVFERRSAPFVEPLMGWTGSRDPLTQLELTFPTLDAAVAYAQRQGLRYMVRHDARSRRSSERRARRRRAFSDAILGRLGLPGLQRTYGQAMADADLNPPPPNEPAARLSAMDIVRDPASLGGRQTLDPHEPAPSTSISSISVQATPEKPGGHDCRRSSRQCGRLSAVREREHKNRRSQRNLPRRVGHEASCARPVSLVRRFQEAFAEFAWSLANASSVAAWKPQRECDRGYRHRWLGCCWFHGHRVWVS